MILIVALWLFSYRENPPRLRIIRQLWSNIREQLWSNTRERTQGNEKRQDEDSSYPKALKDLQRATVRKNCPKSEKVDNPMIAPQDYDGRVLEGYDQQVYPGTFPSF